MYDMWLLDMGSSEVGKDDGTQMKYWIIIEPLLTIKAFYMKKLVEPLTDSSFSFCLKYSNTKKCELCINATSNIEIKK